MEIRRSFFLLINVLFIMSIRNHAYKFIDFGFAELRGIYPARRGSGSSFAPYPKGCEEPNPDLSG